MKRLLTMLAAVLMLTAALTVTAAASDYDAVADDLAAIGMFRGTAAGYELDRAPKRSEAAIMLVRLYGAEEAAKAAYEAGEISHPFTDVSPTASPSVAWLYTNGITNGTTATTFGSAAPCSAKMYCAFLLRALGYQDGADFQYADCLTFAQEKGFYDPMLFAGDFLRDDLAALTYQGLAADLKDGSTYLLASLIDSGAIDAKAAEPMTETIEAYRAMEAATAGMDETAMDMDIDMTMDIVSSIEGPEGKETIMDMTTHSTGSMAIITKDESNIQMAYTVETDMDGDTLSQGVWLKDGWVYQSIEMGGETMKVKQPVGDQLTAEEVVSSVEPTAMDVSGLAMIKSVTVEKKGGNTVYTMVIREDLGGAMSGVEAIMGEDTTNMKFGDMEAAYTIDRSGQLKKIDMVFSASLEEALDMEELGSYLVTMEYGYDMTMNVNATGDEVKIKWPDFSDFQEIDPSQEEIITQEEVTFF